jgi:hypothetical protein
MRSNDTFPYFAFIIVGRFVLKYARYSGTHLSHKMPPHHTHVDGVYFLSYFSLNITPLYDLVHCVKLCRPLDVALTLRDIGKSEYLGEILLSATLWPRTQEDKDQVSYVTPAPYRSLRFAASMT